MSATRKLTLRIDDPLAPIATRTTERVSDRDGGALPSSPRAVQGTTIEGGEVAVEGRLRVVAIDSVSPNRQQPRRRFDEEALQALTDSIRERGVLQPPVVREASDGRLELIAGERRWRAARLAGLVELEVLVNDSDDSDTLQDALTENILRQDLSPVEEARAYATLVEDLGISREELGRRIGRSRVSISNHIRLLDLPDDVLHLLDTGLLTFAHGRALLLCDDSTTRRTLANRAVTEGWSKRRLEDAAREAGAPRAKRPKPERVTADQHALAEHFSDTFSRAFGADIQVRAGARDTYTFTVHGHDIVRKLANQLDPRRPDAI